MKDTGIKLGGRQTMADKMRVAERYRPNALDKAPSRTQAAKPKVTVKPMGGLKASGLKATVKQKFNSGKWVK